MAERIGCARRSRAANEDIAGTASRVRRWLLIEQPGPWGADALRESRLDPGLAGHLDALCRRLLIRVLLIRRHGRGTATGPRVAFAAVSDRDWRSLERLTFTDPAELLDLDWTRLVANGAVGGTAVDGPLLLVCTNGRHDACCAEHGRPVAEALTAAAPQATWESSHFGGDRFAANVVWLPHGIYYGRVRPADTPAVAALAHRGRLSLPHLRGRSCLPFDVQAAEIALRGHTGMDGVDDLAVTGHERVDDETKRVAFRDRTGRGHVVVVTTSRQDEPRALTCGAAPLRAPRYEARVAAPDESQPDHA